MADNSDPIKNIVLVGRTGNGKSATGNSIAGRKVFRTSSAGVTMECQTFLTSDGPILNVIDTPGLFDASVSAEFISREIVRCLTLAEGGLHAMLVVLSARNRITQEEERVLDTLQILFGSKILDYVIVVFSGGDVLEEECLTLEEYLSGGCPQFLKEVLILCGQRKMLFDNKTMDAVKKEKQVHELITLVDQVGKYNNRKPYTDELNHKIKEETDRHKDEHKELESKGHSEEKLEAARKELQLMYEQNLKVVSDMMEKIVKAIVGKDATDPPLLCSIQ